MSAEDTDTDTVFKDKIEWSIAQVEPGLVNSTWWAIIDTTNRFSRGRWYGRDGAQNIVDMLNGTVGERIATNVADALVKRVNEVLEDVARRAGVICANTDVAEQVSALIRSAKIT